MDSQFGRERTLEYQPALDGLRAVSVLLVLGFHSGIGLVSGGYLGVSVFFTLSGFLITTLLLTEHRRTGRIALGRFYLRRLRRLIPASIVTLAAVLVAVRLSVFDGSRRLQGQISSAALQVLNWHELIRGHAYADLFVAPSPVIHFWSLGIEEQFYWLWPLAVVAILSRRVRRARSPVLAIGGAWVVTSASAPLTALWWSPAASYYASWTRASEILAGALIAAVLLDRSTRPWVGRLSGPLLLLLLGVVVLTPAAGGWAYNGGLPLFGVLSGLVIASLQAPSTARRALSLSPLVGLGRISYGVYLLHWPIFLILTPQRVGWDGVPLHLLRLGVTVAAAIVSYVAVERPIRFGARPETVRVAVFASGAAAVAVVVASVAIVTPPPAAPLAPPVIAAPPVSDVPTSSVPGSPVTVPQGPSHVVAIFGDSLPAWLMRDAAPSYTRTDVAVLNGAIVACDGMVDLPVARDRRGTELFPPDDCRPWTQKFPDVLDNNKYPADIALLLASGTPVLDHLVDGVWLPPCQGTDWYFDDFMKRVDYLRGRGLAVVVTLPAHPGYGATYSIPDDVQERMTCVREAMRKRLDAAAVATIDLEDVLCPEGDCSRLRTHDGIHVDPGFAPYVLNWLLDRAIDVAAAQS